jgi:hypothetical protein
LLAAFVADRAAYACSDLGANGRCPDGTVDKAMHIHRNECAERLRFAGTPDLYAFRASRIQGLFSPSGIT